MRTVDRVRIRDFGTLPVISSRASSSSRRVASGAPITADPDTPSVSLSLSRAQIVAHRDATAGFPLFMRIRVIPARVSPGREARWHAEPRLRVASLCISLSLSFARSLASRILGDSVLSRTLGNARRGPRTYAYLSLPLPTRVLCAYAHTHVVGVTYIRAGRDTCTYIHRTCMVRAPRCSKLSQRCQSLCD